MLPRKRPKKLLYLCCVICLIVFPFYVLNSVDIGSIFVLQLQEPVDSSRYFDKQTVNMTVLDMSDDVFRVSNSRLTKHKKDIFAKDFILKNTQVTTLLADSTIFCGGNFTGYAHLFADLYNVRLDPSKNTNHKGGEPIDEVKNQDEQTEYLTLMNGFFSLSCSNKTNVNYKFNENEPKSQWLNSLELSRWNYKSNDQVFDKFTIAVQRYEYVNVYHTMTDWYNTFLITLIFKQIPQHITVLWLDAHPKGSLDSVWKTLFGETLQASRLHEPIYFRRLIWSINGYASFINQHKLKTVPYLEEFREFFLTRFNVSIFKEKNCRSMNIIFLFRHDYVAHPRNMGGTIKRKIENEEDIIESVRQKFPSHTISGVQLDSFSFRKQLEIIANTDVLIGMHGAGLTMSLFLPSHGGLIELFPLYYSPSNVHFKSIAQWRNLTYVRWQNRIRTHEHKHFKTYIPPQLVIDLIKQVLHKMC